MIRRRETGGDTKSTMSPFPVLFSPFPVLFRFPLFLTVMNTVPIVPSKEVDGFWHQHILDTRKYAEDCDTLFGFFLHHFPYFGMRGVQDEANLAAAFAETRRIYEATFGESFPVAQDAQAEECSSCGPSSCGGAGCVNAECGGDIAPGDIMAVSVRPSFAATQ